MSLRYNNSAPHERELTRSLVRIPSRRIRFGMGWCLPVKVGPRGAAASRTTDYDYASAYDYAYDYD